VRSCDGVVGKSGCNGQWGGKGGYSGGWLEWEWRRGLGVFGIFGF
jgi:hypothetical protein